MNVGCRVGLITGAMLFACGACICALAKRPCSTCLPMKEKKCVNTLPLHVDVVIDSPQRDGGVVSTKGGGMLKKCARSDSLEDHMSLAVEARYDFRIDGSSCIDCASNNTQGSLSVDLKASHSSLDEMMSAAHGDKLLYSDGGPNNSEWC